MRKYTRTEGKPEVLSPEDHKAIETELTKLGSTSAREVNIDFEIVLDKSQASNSVVTRR